MRLIAITIALAVSLSAAVAQQTVPQSTVDDLKKSTGSTDLKSHQQNNQATPQGPSGPLNTTTGGAPAGSPQGQTPPGMQAAPEGSDKTISAPKDK